MSVVHLICGPTAAGKSTYAKELAQELGCARFAIDEWMANLYSHDTAEVRGIDWLRQRADRCEHQIWSVSRQLLKLGQDVVLDLGLPKRRNREKYRHLALAANSVMQLHYIQADPEVRKARVLQRNTSQMDASVIPVTEDMFMVMEGVFEAPEGLELEGAKLVSTDQ